MKIDKMHTANILLREKIEFGSAIFLNISFKPNTKVLRS